MSEEQKKETSTPVEAKEEVKQEQPKTESKSFTQEQLDNIVQARLMAERKKYERKMEEEEKQKTELLKQNQVEEAKSKSRDLYEEIRFAPIHGPTPTAPEMEPKKSSASLIFSLGATAAGAFE